MLLCAEQRTLHAFDATDRFESSVLVKTSTYIVNPISSEGNRKTIEGDERQTLNIAALKAPDSLPKQTAAITESVIALSIMYQSMTCAWELYKNLK